MAIDYGRPPKGGFAKLVSELFVEDLCESLYFWREALGFEIAYQRPEQKFAYLQRPEAQELAKAGHTVV
jgi:catechol 2,3-dioxygenase-like lactoylglutathione lyase family enzyme